MCKYGGLFRCRNLKQNQLRRLPDDVFAGLTALDTVYVDRYSHHRHSTTWRQDEWAIWPVLLALQGAPREPTGRVTVDDVSTGQTIERNVRDKDRVQWWYEARKFDELHWYYAAAIWASMGSPISQKISSKAWNRWSQCEFVRIEFLVLPSIVFICSMMWFSRVIMGNTKLEKLAENTFQDQTQLFILWV